MVLVRVVIAAIGNECFVLRLSKQRGHIYFLSEKLMVTGDGRAGVKRTNRLLFCFAMNAALRQRKIIVGNESASAISHGSSHQWLLYKRKNDPNVFIN